MGSDGVTSTSRSSLREIFNDAFPYYLSIGMTYEQYWEGQPSLVAYYRKADEMTRKRKNQELWLQGFYVYNAIGSFAEILPAFPKKGAKVKPYLKEPLSITTADADAKMEREKKARVDRIKQKMMGFVKRGD